MKRRKLTPAERREIYDKCGGHCAYCGQKISLKEMQADHVVSLRRGGADRQYVAVMPELQSL